LPCQAEMNSVATTQRFAPGPGRPIKPFSPTK
jgi:hypothetical protein